MEYWWEARKFGGESVLLKPDEAEVVMLAKKVGDSVTIPRLRMQIDTKGIADVEQTDRPLDKSALLGSGADSQPVAMIPIEGSFPNSVQAAYVKRRVPWRVWERKYSGSPGYWVLRGSDDDSEVWVVFTRPVYDGALPEGIEELESWELKLMQRHAART